VNNNKKDTSGEATPADKDSFAVSAPAITLPKGGGAVRGIGEKFAANPVTGTGSMSVPISTSPGRTGFGPQLSLSYDSGAGNGAFGLGWNLSLPSITRKTDKGLPKYQDADESDVFILSGAEDLVPLLKLDTAGNVVPDPEGRAQFVDNTQDDYRVRRYRPRIEGLFARIEKWTALDGSHAFWRSISKDNITTWYGKTEKSRIADPTDPARIFSWLMCESYDDKGNAILYQYKAENDDDVDPAAANERNRSRTAQRYLKRIKYGNKTPRQPNENIALRTDWMFEAVFDYGEHYAEDVQGQPTVVDITGVQRPWAIRQDPFSSYRAGFEVRTYRLCQRVLMFHHFPGDLELDDYLVRATHFEISPDPAASFITGVTQSGYQWQAATATYLKKSLPPVEFEYSKAHIDETVRDVDADSLENLPYGLDGANYQWVDLDGEGLSGILTEQGGAWFYKRSLGAIPISAPHEAPQYAARFAPVERLPSMPSPANLKGGQQLLDLAGDGQLDVVEFDGPTPGFFERTPDEGWETYTPFASLPNVAWKDPNLKFVDLTGDGHADILVTENEVFTWHPSLAEEGFGPAEKVHQPFDEEAGPRLVFADGTQSMYLSDFSGDGLTDLVRIRNGEVCYWPNLGYGRFGKKVTMDNAPWFDAPDQFDQKRIRLTDIDGSGTVDILYLSRDGVDLYFNHAGNRWSPAHKLNNFPRIDNLSSVMAADLFGNGTACLVWSSPLPGDARRPMRYIDLMGGQKPHLLVKTRNNLGAETQVHYAPSTQFYLADKAAGRPWITKLPFPVHCVERVSVIDHWRETEFASTYSYHHGYFDGIEREFRGFGRVEQVDVEAHGKFQQGNVTSPYITDDHDLYQPPIKTITWYHTGVAVERDRILSAFEQEYFTAPGFTEHTLPPPTLTPADLTAEEWREAARACKGMMLRQEVYELDVDALELGQQLPVRLFTTAFHNSTIQRLQPRGDNRQATFLVTESEAITYHYELDLKQGTPDPRIAHTLNMRFDKYGRVLQTVAVAYPRQVAFTEPTPTLTPDQVTLIQAVQRQRHLVYTETRYTDELLDDPHQHRLPPPCEVRTYELTGDHPTQGYTPSIQGLYFSLDDLRSFQLSDTLPGPGTKAVAKLDYHQQPINSSAHKRIVEWVRMLYFKDDLSGAEPFGTTARLGLPYETYKLALTGDLLGAVFGAKLTPDVLAILDTPTSAGYAPGTALDASLTGQYWIRSGTAGFENDAAQHFYLPERYTDPFGNITTLKYDPRDLFIQSSTDMLGNTSGVTIVPPTGKPRFDYRVLAPLEMVDTNDNHTEVYVDILGRVVATAVKGKGSEADTLMGFDDALANPPASAVQRFCTASTMNLQQARDWLGQATARFVYHFGEGRDTNGNFTGWVDRPPGACGIAREIHFNAPGGANSPLQVALECSDGGGNVLMKKVQAEPDPDTGQPRWIVNGLTVLNNKGKPVKQYEPSFVPVFGCSLPTAVGVTPLMYYDAAGRLVRTEMPDGTFSKVEFSPWHMKAFDANDTVKDSRWYFERLTATVRGVPLPGPNASPQEKAEAADAEALAQNASAQDQRAARLAAQHANTPSETHLDSLGREVIALAHNKYIDAAGNAKNEKYLTYTKLDAEGKPLWIRDARGNLVMQYITPAKANNDPSEAITANAVPCYDIAGNLLFQHSMDAGDRWMLMDAAGKPMFAWDRNESQTGTVFTPEARLYFTKYDPLHRPIEQWLSADGGTPKMIERFEYRDTKRSNGTPNAQLATDQAANLIGQLAQHYDPSGLTETVRLDFKGNVLEVARRLNNQPTEALIDWQGSSPQGKLDGETFRQLTEYDALNRMTRHYNWHRAAPDNRVAFYEPVYNARGLLSGENLTVRASKTVGGFATAADTKSNDAIKEIRYNAKGQKELVILGNDTITHYAYDDKTFRLRQLRTARPNYDPPFPTYRADLKDHKVLQQLHYTYDPVGNIAEIGDEAYRPAFFQNAIIEPRSQYEYDALYRLIQATGRENGAATGAPSQSETKPPDVTFPIPASNALSKYTQTYQYDPVGNIIQMNHAAGNGSWTRNYDYAFNDTSQTPSNRLWRTWQGDDNWTSDNAINKVTYVHDAHGNMLNLAQVAADKYLKWDHRDMIANINLSGGGQAYYQYDSGKQRTRKRIVDQNNLGGYWERIYLGSYELYRRYNGNSATLVEEIESHHLFEGEQRLLLVDDVVISSKGSLHPRPEGLVAQAQTLFRYQYSNHLGSACLDLDDHAEIISYEEYHPYGTSAYRTMKSGIEAPSKRYRYTGMERDEESGLNYHGVRHCAVWLGRWAAPDPRFLVDGVNIYAYVSGNPLRLIDRTGSAGVTPPPGPIIGDFPKLYQAWLKSTDEVLKSLPGFDYLKELKGSPETLRMEENINRFEKYVQKIEATFGKGSNRQVGTARNIARETYASVRTIFGGLVKEMGGSLKGIQVHHLFGGIFEHPSKALDAGALMLQEGQAAVKGTGHNLLHFMEKLGGKNPGPKAIQELGEAISKNADKVGNIVEKTMAAVLQKGSSIAKPVSAFIGKAGKVAGTVAEGIKPAASAIASGAKSLGGILAKGAKFLPIVAALFVAKDAHAAVTTQSSSERVQKGADFAAGGAGFLGPVGMALSLGYAAGGLINTFALSEDTQNTIGGTLDEIINQGGFKEIVRHPFGIGL
jgi:RHS repeat-associated protein